MNAKKLLAGLAATIAIILAWGWWSSDARRISSRLDDMIAAVAKSSGENQLNGALKAQEFAGHYAEPFVFRARQFDFETRSRQDLVRAVLLYRTRSERIATRVLDKRLDVDNATRRATMFVTARFVGGWRSGSDDAYRFQLNWVEQAGEWKIDYADLVEVVPVAGL